MQSFGMGRTTTVVQWVRRYGASGLVMLTAWLLLAAAPLAGTKIQNHAMVFYTDSATGREDTQPSNSVTVLVERREALTLTADQTVSRPPGAIVILMHRLTNTGNDRTTYALQSANLPGDDYDLTAFTLTLDANKNGFVDPGEHTLNNGDTLELDAGGAVDLLIAGSVPLNVPIDKKAQVTITATSQVEGRTATNTDTIIASKGAAIQLVKSASSFTPQRGEEVTFTLVASNSGNGAATGTAVVVDGATTSLVVIRDVIPANMTFARVLNPGNGTPLYHGFGAPLHTYTSAPPAALTQVDAVAIGYPDVRSGQQRTFRFSATVNANASGTTTNTGVLFGMDGGTALEVVSNTISLAIPTVAPTIAYYTSDRFTTIAPVTSVGSLLFVQADAAACNQRPTVLETVVLSITSALTGDVESFSATEIAANSGIFRIVPPPPTADATTQARQNGNGRVETVKNDVLTARLEGCGARVVEATILVDPFGVVFDSKTNVPLLGAKVTLVDVTGAGNGGNAGAPAQVFQPDGVTSAPSTLATDTGGQFAFLLVRPSTYRLAIVAPQDYAFPSTVTPTALPPGRIIDAAGSYGNPFNVGPALSPVRLDIPLDRQALGGLLVEKKASRNVVEIGDFVDYTLSIQNTRSHNAENARLTDHLPAGFVMQRGSARLEKVSVPDPLGVPGPKLVFALGTIPANARVTLTYRVRIGPGALQGDGTNRAQAESPPPVPLLSNVAIAKVEVRGGVFDDKGFITGKVFVDCNRNRLQDQGEVGIPGVRLYLQDGTFVITDSEGKFSFVGVTPRTHVLKLDKTTLPAGAKLVPLAARHAGAGDSRFVDMKNRDLHKADFAEGSCSPEVLAEVKARRSQSDVFVPEVVKGLSTDLQTTDQAIDQRDARSLPASGLQHSKDTLPHFSPIVSRPLLDEQTSTLPAPPVQPIPSVDLAPFLATADNALGFIDLKEGDTLPVAQTNVRVKGQAGVSFVLTVNDIEVPSSRVGSKSTSPANAVEAWEYIGVDLRPGKNVLVLRQRDAFGNMRGLERLTVIAPDKLSTVKLLVETPRPIADGRTPVPLAIVLQDASGVPVTVRTPVTVETNLGRWQEADLDSREPGLQLFVTGGKATVHLLPPITPGDALVRVSSGILRTEVLVPFFPELRPLIAAGVMEGAIHFRRLDAKTLLPARKQDGFERELRNAAFRDGKVQGGARAALFLKGKIKGDYLLTAAYDSDKETQERLFRDIKPDEFYPVYGDSSVRGFDAQTSGRLYVRVDKNKSYLLYGDFTTETRNPASNLGHYNRSLTGGKLHYEDQRFNVTAFASNDSTKQVVEEIPGRGISGPYKLRNSNFVDNSEKVEILIRDRNQSSIILETIPQTRFTDYEINQLDGSILFTTPVRSVDSQLNPVSIRVTYEIDQGGKDFWTYGGDAQIRITDFFQVGGSYAREDDPRERYEVAGINAIVKLSDRTYMIAEMARTARENFGSGLGWRGEIVHEDERLKARLYLARTEKQFDNPVALLGRGRVEAQFKATYKLTDRTRLIGEALHTQDIEKDGRRDGGRLSVGHQFGNGVYGELGMRHSRETAAEADRPDLSATRPFETTSVLAKLGTQVPFLPQLGVFVEYEQDIFHLDRQRAAVGGEYQFLNRGRIYAKHEFLTSLRGLFALNSEQKQYNTIFGVDLDYIKNGQVFSEYRVDNGMNGRDAQAAIGLRHRFYLAEGLVLHAGFERAHTVEGTGNDSMAVTSAVEYVILPDFKTTARLEWRDSDSGKSFLNTLGVAYKLSQDWTVLGKHALFLEEGNAREHLRVGLAYRDTTTNVWTALLRYEYKLEDEEALLGIRQAHILAASVNYQLIRPLILSGYAAAKWVIDRTNGLESRSHTYLTSARATYDITDRWDVGIMGSTLFSGNLTNIEYGLGIEIGRMVADNLWLSAGYNFFGFEDVDLVDVSYSNPGFFFRFRFKFDEDFLHDTVQTVSHAFGSRRP